MRVLSSIHVSLPGFVAASDFRANTRSTMSDGHGTVKTTSGMVVQVMRGPSSQSPFVDPGNTPQRILLQQQVPHHHSIPPHGWIR
jgi:hypothetical protein